MKPHRIRMAHNLIVNYGLCDNGDEDDIYGSGPSSSSGRGIGSGGMIIRETEEDLEVKRDRKGGWESGGGGGSQGMGSGSRGKGMQVFRPRRAGKGEMTRFHSDEYVDFLERVTPETVEMMTGGGVRCEFLSFL